MNRLDILQKINEFSYNNDLGELINLLNELLSKSSYIDEYLDLILIIIDTAQLYGYTSYLTNDVISTNFKNSEIFNYRSNSYNSCLFQYLNYGQLSLLDTIRNSKKVLISAPTSFGKTSIVNEYIVENSVTLNQILYIVPTNSLTEELFTKLIKFNKQYKLNYNISTRPSINFEKNNILVLTPERFLMLIENVNIINFDLIVMDEAYKIINHKNSTISDFVNDRSYKFRRTMDIIAASDNKAIFLSPYTYRLTDSMKDFVKKYDINVVNKDIEYVSHKIINLENQKYFNEYFNPNDKHKYLSNLSIHEKASIILEELRNEKNIIYVSSYDTAYKIMDSYNIKINIREKSSRFIDFYKHLLDKYSSENLEIWKIIKGLEKGIGIYISPIPRYVKKELVNLYNNNEITSFIVTTSFVEGINTDAKNIIITSQYTARNQKLTELDLLNIAGRAGRFGEHSIGNILVIENDVYKRIRNIYEEKIELSNPNYEKTINVRNEYAIDMISDNYLNDEEQKQKTKTIEFQELLKLTNSDLNRSLNVSKIWKLILYSYFSNLSIEEIMERNITINSLLNSTPGEVANSLEILFIDIKNAFLYYEDQNPFPTEVYDIRPFSNKGDFIWKKLYIMHSYGSIKEILNNKKRYIESIQNEIVEQYGKISDDKYYKHILTNQGKSWIMHYLDSKLNIKDSSIYTETFKFISNIMQYKIPFYVNFYVSIYKLYIEKNYIAEIDIEKLDPLKIANYFENGNLEERYQEMLDYGIPLELLKRIQNSKKHSTSNKNLDLPIDNYEKMLISDFQEAIK